MVADFSELHHEILQIFGVALAARVGAYRIFFLDISILDLLPVREFNLDNFFGFVGELLFDLLFDSPEEERAEHLMQSVNDEELFFLTEEGLHLSLIRSLAGLDFSEGHREPLFEIVAGVENFREEEVEQTPEFSEVILEGRTREQNPVLGVVLLGEY